MNEIASSSTPPAAQPVPLRPCPFCGTQPEHNEIEEGTILCGGCLEIFSFTPEKWNRRADTDRAPLVSALRIAETFVRGKAQFFGATHECGNLDCATCDENRTLTAIRKALAGEPLPAPDPSRAALVAALAQANQRLEIIERVIYHIPDVSIFYAEDDIGAIPQGWNMRIPENCASSVQINAPTFPALLEAIIRWEAKEAAARQALALADAAGKEGR